MIDIYKTVKPSHLEKLKIIQNINNLMFYVISIFANWILIKQIIVSSTPFCCWGKQIFKKFCLEFCVGNRCMGTGAWIKMPIFNAFSRNGNTINLKCFPIHGGIYKLEKIQQGFWRDNSLRSLKKYERMYPWG